MSNLEITNNDVQGIVIWEPVYDDEILVSAAAATYKAGTILGRITADGNLTAYVPGETDGSGVPVAVLCCEEVLEAGVTKPVRPILAGRVRRKDMVVHDTTDPITKAAADALRDYGIVPLSTTELSELDNQ